MSETATTPVVGLKALIEQRARLDALIAEEQSLHKAENVRKVQAFIRDHGLTVDDVFPGQSKSPKVAAVRRKFLESRSAHSSRCLSVSLPVSLLLS